MTRAPVRLFIACFMMAGVWASAGWSEEQAAPAANIPDRVNQALVRANIPPAIEKLGRGIANIAGGWLEIPLTIEQRYLPQDAGTSLAVGAITGLFKGLGRTVVGAYETLTFFLPVPANFAPILPTLAYFDKAPNRQPLLLE